MASSNSAIIPPSRPSETNYTTLRDVSFSSYLNPSEENYIRNLVNTTHHLNKNVIRDEEIDVFSADKYFNGEVDYQGSNNNTKTTKNEHQFIEKHNEKTLINLSKLNLQPRTPSIYSESSSWNSQSGLLRPVQRNPSKGKNDIKVKKNIKSSFFYCCNDHKSIEIEFQDRLSSNQVDNNNSSCRREESITRTIKTSFDTAEIARLNKLRSVDLNPNPDPFTFPVTSPVLTSVKNLQIDKKNMLSWDSSTKPCGTYIDDTESDASSDLFEIECLTCTGNNNPNGHGHGGCGTPTTRYEPSEVSVDWSVVTASAADYSEDQRSTLTSVTGRGVGPKLSSTVKRVETKGGQKSRSGGLLGGCRSQKAVRVAEDVYRNPSCMKSTLHQNPRVI